MTDNHDRMSFRRPVVLIGWMLIVAALLKGVETATSPTADWSRSISGELSVALVGAEVFVGSWLVCGFYPAAGRVAAIGLFCSFAVVNSLQLASGVTRCGCLGPIRVSPWLTLAIDLMALVALALFRPLRSRDTAISWHTVRFAVAWLACIGAVAGTATVRYSRTWSEEIVIVEPTAWIGARLPLLDDIDVAEHLDEGDWLLVFYVPDCEACRAEIQRAEARARSEGFRLALITVQLNPSSGREHYVNNHEVVYGQLRQGKSWMVRVPLTLRLRDGIVLELE
jgi:hypothetical protein